MKYAKDCVLLAMLLCLPHVMCPAAHAQQQADPRSSGQRPRADRDQQPGDAPVRQQVRQPDRREAQAGPGQPIAGPGRLPIEQLGPPPEFQLTPQDQEYLDRVLAAWEKSSSAVQNYRCKFTRWEYDLTFPPKGADGKPNPNLANTESSGELKYVAPSNGLFRVTEVRLFSPESLKFEKPKPAIPGEHWICNEKSIIEVDHSKSQVTEHRLPPELQGKPISEGPLPFVFGAKAAAIKQRYFIRVTQPPEGVQNQIWLEALPRWRQDRANFVRAELILGRQDLMPVAMQIYDSTGQKRTVYQFEPDANRLKAWANMLGDFLTPETPLGYKYVVEDVQAPPASGEKQSDQTPPRRQAQGTPPSARSASIWRDRSANAPGSSPWTIHSAIGASLKGITTVMSSGEGWSR